MGIMQCFAAVRAGHTSRVYCNNNAITADVSFSRELVSLRRKRAVCNVITCQSLTGWNHPEILGEGHH
jgi:hypothetical protein